MSKSRKICDGRYGKSYENILTREFLETEYLKNGKGIKEICDIVGCTPHTVYSYIDYYDIQRINLMGTIKENQKFGLLTTIKVVSKTSNGTLKWLCKCDCGNNTEVRTSQLKNGEIKSCGCLKHRKANDNPIYKGYCDVTGNRMSELRYRANKKGIDFDLDPKFLWELYIKQNKRCAISGVDLELNINGSLDRIDSNGGYIKNNVQWVHVIVNKMKIDLPQDEFINWCKIISNNNN